MIGYSLVQGNYIKHPLYRNGVHVVTKEHQQESCDEESQVYDGFVYPRFVTVA